MIELKQIGSQMVPVGPAVAYVRVSTDGQAADDNPRMQRETIVQLAKLQGNQILKEFYDEGMTGASLETRQGYMEMKEWIEQGRVKIVYAFSASRLCRPEESKVKYRILGLFAEHDVWVVTNSHIYPPGSSGFQGAIEEAGADNVNRQEVTIRGKRQKALTFGRKSMGGGAYGWVWNKRAANKLGDWEMWDESLGQWMVPPGAVSEYGRYEIQAEDYQALQLIWRLALEGKGSSHITDELHRRKMRHRSERKFQDHADAISSGRRPGRAKVPLPGKPWTRNDVDRILKNPIYGSGWQVVRYPEKLRWQIEAGEEQTFTHIRYRLPKPVVTEEQFQIVQEMRQRRKKCSSRNAKYPFLLTGKLRCGECGASLYSSKVKQRGRWAHLPPHRYYFCDMRVKRRVAERRKVAVSVITSADTCELPYMSVEDVDKVVWHLIVWPYLSDPKRIRAEVETQLEGNDRRPELRERLDRLHEQLDVEIKKIGRIKDLAVAGALTPREAAEERQKVDNEAAATKQAISKIESEIAGYEMQRETLDNLEKQLESYRYRLILYERKDNTDAQPTKRLRRKAFLDFVGDGNVTVSVQKPGWVELVVEPVFNVAAGDHSGREATYRVELRTEHCISPAKQ